MVSYQCKLNSIHYNSLKIYKKKGDFMIKLKKTFLKIIVTFISISILYAFLSISASAYPEAQYIVSNRLYYIKNNNSGKYLTVVGNNDINGANVVQASFTAQKGQQWRVIHLGNGIYKIVSEVGTKTRVLEMRYANNNNGNNVDIWSDNNTSERRFRIIRNNDNFTYRIASQCSNFAKVVTVKEASCQQNANVFQYQYNGSKNDEWYFEPVVNYSPSLAVNYAIANYNKRVTTYPAIDRIGGDCANFASQCMVAGGVHYQGTWWVYKLNNAHAKPRNSNELDSSWKLSNPSPWISAYEFNKFWSARVKTEIVSAKEITDNPKSIFSKPFYRGDVVQIVDKDFFGNPNNAWHTMFITDYGSYDGNRTFLLTYHSNDIKNKSLIEIANQYPDSYFKFFAVN